MANFRFCDYKQGLCESIFIGQIVNDSHAPYQKALNNNIIFGILPTSVLGK